VVNVYALVATGVDADGHREILGRDVASAEDGAGRGEDLRNVPLPGAAAGLSLPAADTLDRSVGVVSQAPE
jgi:putative transposase